MALLTVVSILFILPAHAGPTPVASPPTPEEAPYARLRECTLPASLQGRWEEGELDDPTLLVELERYRQERPSLFADTAPPPVGVRPVADFAPMRTLHLVYPGWIDHDETYLGLLEHASKHGDVRVSSFSKRDTARLVARLRKRNVPMERITFEHADPLETIWMRDYGPIPVTTPDGFGVVDFAYTPDCVEDDAYPTRSRAAGQPVWRSSVYLDGGNLVTDGMGSCFITDHLAFESGLSARAVDETLRQWMGCERIVTLEALAGDSAPHVDMLLTPAPDGVLLLASFDPAEDEMNAAIMKRNRALLAARAGVDGAPAWKLVDLPTPATLQRSDATIVRTWNNLLPFNGVVFVPDYSGVPTDRVVRAWNLIQAAFPGRELRGVAADPLIEFGGAVHCVARGEP